MLLDSINIIKFDEFEKDRREKDEITKNFSKQTSEMTQRIDKSEHLVDRQTTILTA